MVSASKDLVAQSAASFFEEFLCGKLNMEHLVVGHDFAFGRGRQGDTNWLRKESLSSGTGITVVEPLRRGGQVISSSLIREYLKNGELDKANELLGRFYHFEGIPEKGRGLGRKLGFPTVNLSVAQEKILPPGVHTAIIGDGNRTWPAVINIGIRPTFFSEGKTVPEINILDFSGNWTTAKTNVYLCGNIRKRKLSEHKGTGKTDSERYQVREKIFRSKIEFMRRSQHENLRHRYLRNICSVGPQGEGKTSVAESLLYNV